MWTDPANAKAFRNLLVKLGYQLDRHSWRFKKPYSDSLNQFVVLETQARTPHFDEDVKIRKNQVGKGKGTDLSGYHTPEAFSVDRSLIALTNFDLQGRLQVPHPYTWLNLKVAAAYDWLREERGEIEKKFQGDTDIRLRLKHVYDVYVLTAMLTEAERDESSALTREYVDHPIAHGLRRSVTELYSDPSGEGVRGVQLYARQSFGTTLRIDHELFWEEGLRPSLGITDI